MDLRPTTPHQPVRSASAELRRTVDAAVGPGYETPFLRLDLLLTSRAARCGCEGCARYLAARRAEIMSSLPTR